MYKIIGADQKEYGPITAEQMRQWAAEGRVNAQTLVWSETSGNWKPLSAYPELANLAAGPQPTGAPVYSATPPAPDRAVALARVSGPAIGLMVTAALWILAGVLGLLMNLTGFGMSGAAGSPEAEQMVKMLSGTVGILTNIIVLIIGAVLFYGAMKMKRLESYGFAIATSIIAMLPCSCACLVGLPFGIWALVVLNKPEVKSSFQ